MAGDPSQLRAIRPRLREWAANYARFDGSPAELIPLSQNLKSVGEIGLDALQYWEAAQPPPSGWAAAQNQALDAFEQPVAEVVLAAVRPVRLLVNAVASR